jgi:hypothetical protein
VQGYLERFSKNDESYITSLPHDTEENILKVSEFFSLDNCPLHSIEFDPLYVQNPKLDLNPEK